MLHLIFDRSIINSSKKSHQMDNKMNYLKLEDDLEATDGGKDQNEIAEWVQEDARFIAYVQNANRNPIPEDPNTDCRPASEWIDSQDFHPNDLIEEACKDLGWYSVPDALNLNLNFQIFNKGA